MIFSMISVLLAVITPDQSIASRMAAVSGVYSGSFRGPASPGCFKSGPLVATVQEAEAGNVESKVFRIRASRTNFRWTFRSGHGNVFVFSGIPQLRGDDIIVRGTYVSSDEQNLSESGPIGSGTFSFVVDAHNNAIINVESFQSRANPACNAKGAVQAGVRIAPFDGRQW